MAEEDLFASLGGSLMRDLLADLQVDEGGDDAGWLSLEQLEQELANLDDTPSFLPMVPETGPVTTTAAGLVVTQQQKTLATTAAWGSSSLPSTQSSAPTTNPAQDAWSLSLEKFTASALEADFLQADSARKQQRQKEQPPSAAGPPPGLDFSQAEEYNVTETASIVRPPGLASDNNQRMLQEAATRLTEASTARPPIPARAPPSTPHNSISFARMERPGPVTPQNSISITPTPPPSAMPTPIVTKNLQRSEQAGPVSPMMPPGTSHQQVPLMASPTPPFGPPVQVPIAVPLPQSGPAWQTPPPPPTLVRPGMHPTATAPVLYCNPHPQAPPIPAAQLSSKYMSARDISYVVHGILRPVLAAGVAESDYDIQYLLRRGGAGTNVQTPSKADPVDGKSQDRQEKTSEWSKKQHVLGHVAKTNVARPRALIAQPVKTDEEEAGKENMEHKARAALWKARIYCDQAHLAFMQVVEIWKAATPGGVPPSLQPHLIKLMKCLGITHNEAYEADPKSLQLLLKLTKGRVLLSRVLEQALLPSKAVFALLPVTLTILYESKPDETDDRLFAALARVVQTIPALPLSGSILPSIKAAQTHNPAALSTTCRIQAVHALLQRGNQAASEDPSRQDEWKQAENDFMESMSGL